MDEIQVTVNPADDHFSSDSEPESDDEVCLAKTMDEVVTKDLIQPSMPRSKKELFQSDPEVQQWVQELVQQNVQKELANNCSKQGNVDKQIERLQNNSAKKSTPVLKGINSPSDSTIYTPALKKG